MKDLDIRGQIRNSVKESPEGMLTAVELARALSLDVGDIIRTVNADEQLKILPGKNGPMIADMELYSGLADRVVRELRVYHTNYPLRPGMKKDNLHSLVFKEYSRDEFCAFLQAFVRDKIIGVRGRLLHAFGFKRVPDKKQMIKIRQVEKRLLSHPFQPMTWDLILGEVFYYNPVEGKDVLKYLVDKGLMVPLCGDLYFHRRAIENARGVLQQHLHKHGYLTVAETRDLLGSSRKFVVPLLEYFDEQGFTVRLGNKRTSGEGASCKE